MMSWYFLLFLLVTLQSSLSIAKDCISDYGKKCLSSTDPGAGLYFNYFGWTGGNPCFLNDEKRACLVSSSMGLLHACTCTEECGCTGEEPVEPLVCDGSSVQPASCAEQQTQYCPLTTTNANGETVGNTACLKCGVDSAACYQSVCEHEILTQDDKDEIVRLHNMYRSQVANGQELRGVGGGQPPATDMSKLEWNEDLAYMAQLWADQCPNDHNPNPRVPEFTTVGENLADRWNSRKDKERHYAASIQAWYDEVKDFPPGNVGAFSSQGATGVVGHYTQLVWAKTTKVGCGYMMYKDSKAPQYPYRKTLVCNYGPAGNFLGQPVYTAGPTASDCTGGSENGLCI